MHKIFVTGGAAIAIAAAGYVGFNAWLAWGLPARPISNREPVKGCEGVGWHGNDYTDSPLQCRARLQEARVIKATPGLAVRDRNTLTIFYRGKPAYRLVPSVRNGQAMKDDECDALDLHKAMALFDLASGQKEYVPLISCHLGEFENRFVAMPDGSRWIVRDASASPDGKIIATGTNDVWSTPTGFTLWSWPSRRPIIRFAPSCRVIDWKKATQLTVTCRQCGTRRVIPVCHSMQRSGAAVTASGGCRQRAGCQAFWVTPTTATLNWRPAFRCVRCRVLKAVFRNR